MEGLGRLFDLGTGAVPVDINTADGWTGKRIALRNCKGLTMVVFAGVAASGTDDLTLTVQQHTAYTGGTSATLTSIDHYYVKSETALDNDESWSKITAGISSGVITFAGATYAAVQKIIAIEVDPRSLTDGYTHVSLNGAITTAAAQLAGVLYIPHSLSVRRTPASMGNWLRPGVANA